MTASPLDRTTTEPPPTPTLSLAILAGATFASSASIRVSDPLLPQVAASFGTSAGAASSIVTAFSLAYGLTLIFYGAAGDRLGKFRLIALTTLLSAVGSLACALAPSLPTLAAARLVTGATSCAIIPLSFAWIGDVIPFARRQTVLARFLSGQIMGMIAGQVAGGILGDTVGWRWVFGALAILYVLAGLALLARQRHDPLTRPIPVTAASGGSLIAAWRGTFGLVRDGWVRRVVMVVGIEGFLFFGAFAYIGHALRQRFDIDYTVVGLVLAAYGLGGLLFSATVARLVLLLGPRGLARGGGALSSLCFVILAWAPNLPLAGLAIGLCGLSFFMLHNTLQTQATQMAPAARGASLALFATAFFLGQSLGVALAAPVVDHIGVAPVFMVAAIGLPLLGVWLAASLSQRL